MDMYLFLEQWQRPEEPLHLPEPKFSELHFLFKEEDKGGFPAEETWERLVIWNADEEDGCLLSVSPVKDDINEFPAEEYEKLMVADESFLSKHPLFTVKKSWGW